MSRFEIFCDWCAWWGRLYDSRGQIALHLGPCAGAQGCIERVVDLKRACMTTHCLVTRCTGRIGFYFTVEGPDGEVLATSVVHANEVQRDAAMAGVRLLAQTAHVVMRDGECTADVPSS
jgi:hypothetical protein